jgi:hypothetical protein
VENGAIWSREGAKANAIDFLEMCALVFQTEGKIGNARAARAIAELIRTNFQEPNASLPAAP